MSQKVKKIILLYLIVVLGMGYLATSPNVYAATASTSSSTLGVSSSSSPSATVAEKLKALKDEIASKASELKAQISKKVANKAWQGKIKQIDDSRISLETKSGEKVVTLNEFSEFFDQRNERNIKKIKLTNLDVDDLVVALGDIDDGGKMVAKRVILIKLEPKLPEVVWGQIKELGSKGIILKTKDGEMTLVTDGATSFFIGAEEGSLKDAVIGVNIIATGSLTGSKFGADYVYFVPKKSSSKVLGQSVSRSGSLK